jgi:DNA-binding XRE family transcriptional regulator
MEKTQIIYKDGEPAFAVVPWPEYRRLVPRDADAADIAAVRDAKARIAAGERTVPGEIAFAVADGAAPVAAWRRFRKLSQAKLARAARLNPAHLSQIETGKRNPGIATLGRLAKALGTTREMLLPPLG